MPTPPSSNLIAVNNLAGNLPESPARIGLVVGPSVGGTVNSIVRDDSINTALSEFGGGPATEVAGTALSETDHGALYQIKSASSTAGTVGSVTKTAGATQGTAVDSYGAVLATGASFNGDVLFTAKVAGAELSITVGGATNTIVTGNNVALTVTNSTTGAQLAALITGVPAALAIWGATALGSGAAVCAQSLSTYSETAGRIVVRALQGSIQYRVTVSGTNTALAVALTGGTIVDVTQSTNANGEPTGTALAIQSLLASLAAANPGVFTSSLAGAGTGLLGAKSLTSLTFGSTGAMTVSGSPNDAYEVTVAIRTGGALGAADFRVSLGKANGVPIFGPAVYLIPSSGVVTLPDTGLTLTFTGSFDALDRFAFATTAPTSTLADIISALEYFKLRPERAGLVAVAGQIPVTDIPAWVAALGVEADALEAEKKYLRILLELAGPGSGQSNANWASQVAALTANLAHPRLSIFGGAANMVSSLPLPQPGRFEVVNGNRAMFARALRFPSGRDVGDQSLGAGLTGVLQGLQTDIAASLAGARLSYLYLLSGVPGVHADFLLFDSNTGDFTYGVYGRVLDEAMYYGSLRQTRYLNTAQRRTRSGTIDPGAALAIEQDLTQVLVNKMVKTGQINAAYVVVDKTNTDNRLKITYYVQPLFYVRQIDGRAGIVPTLSSVQVL